MTANTAKRGADNLWLCAPGNTATPRQTRYRVGGQSRSMTSQYWVMTASTPGSKGKLNASIMLNQPAACDSQSSR